MKRILLIFLLLMSFVPLKAQLSFGKSDNIKSFYRIQCYLYCRDTVDGVIKDTTIRITDDEQMSKLKVQILYNDKECDISIPKAAERPWYEKYPYIEIPSPLPKRLCVKVDYPGYEPAEYVVEECNKILPHQYMSITLVQQGFYRNYIEADENEIRIHIDGQIQVFDRNKFKKQKKEPLIKR